MATHPPRGRARARTFAGILTVLAVALASAATGPAAGAAPLPAAARPTPAHGRPAPTAPVAPQRPLRDHGGIHVVSATWVSERMVDVTMSTQALAQLVHVRVLVPSTYAGDRRARYPSIYLLHGCAAGRPSNGLEYREWSNNGVEQITADAPAIVVMPEAGGGGFYTDWSNGGAGGQPKWETFHIEQLVPWVDHNFRTLTDRSHRAIAGLSMGGFGSMSYASRHPDHFGSAASFSGAVDLTNPVEFEALSSVVVTACAAADGGGPDSTFGSHTDHELNWRAHDPARLAENLGNTRLYLYTGNGQPGPLDPPGTAVSIVEQLAHQATIGFHDQLVAAGIPSHFDDYGPGSHSAAYFTRSFQDVLPRFLADFTSPRPVERFTYRSADASYAVFGWRVRIDRTADELTLLRDASGKGFSLSGSGSATVTTGRVFDRRRAYCVTVRSAASVTTAAIRADQRGRLRIRVRLGPPNPYQQYTAAAEAAGTAVYTSTVTIDRSPRGTSPHACRRAPAIAGSGH